MAKNNIYVDFNNLQAVTDNVTGKIKSIRFKKSGKDATDIASYSTDSNGNVTGLILPDGTTRYSPYILAQSGIPMILPCGNGSTAGVQFSGTTGSFTIVGAVVMPVIYAQCYMYFPANQIAGITHTAGFYYVEMSSTSVGIVYNDRYVSGIPTVPTAKTPFTGITSGAWLTQTATADITLASITLPANAMGEFGTVRLTAMYAANNTANAKYIYPKFGGTIYGGGTQQITSGITVEYLRNIRNIGVTNKQKSWSGSSQGSTFSYGGTITSSIDTTANVAITFNGNLFVANTDFLILEAFTIEVLPS